MLSRILPGEPDILRLEAMEDAHTIVLDLDEGQEDSNTFFAVYDGHGGTSDPPSTTVNLPHLVRHMKGVARRSTLDRMSTNNLSTMKHTRADNIMQHSRMHSWIPTQICGTVRTMCSSRINHEYICSLQPTLSCASEIALVVRLSLHYVPRTARFWWYVRCYSGI